MLGSAVLRDSPGLEADGGDECHIFAWSDKQPLEYSTANTNNLLRPVLSFAVSECL